MGEGVADKTLGLERCGIVAIRLGSDTLSIGICASSRSCGREICRNQGPQDDMWWCDARCGNPHGGLHPMTISELHLGSVLSYLDCESKRMVTNTFFVKLCAPCISLRPRRNPHTLRSRSSTSSSSNSNRRSSRTTRVFHCLRFKLSTCLQTRWWRKPTRTI